MEALLLVCTYCRGEHGIPLGHHALAHLHGNGRLATVSTQAFFVPRSMTSAV
jgi:hypothetical protein